MTRKIGNSPFIYDDQGIRALGVINADGSISAFVDPQATSSVSMINGGSRAGICSGGWPAATGVNFMAISLIHARDRLSTISLVLANVCAYYSAGATTENNFGAVAPATIRCSIEYPIGSTPTALKFSGSISGNIPAGSFLKTDAITLPVIIPRGAIFKFRAYYQSPAGVILQSTSRVAVAAGECYQFGSAAAPAPNLVLSTASCTNDYLVSYLPAAVLTSSMRPSVYILGDSLIGGNFNASDAQDASLFRGLLSRAILPYCAGSDVSVPSDRLSLFAAGNSSARVALAAYHSAVICNMGINDIFSGSRTLADLQADVIKIASFFTVPVFFCTLLPNTTSSDFWATLTGQAVNLVQDAVRTSYNDWLRAGGIAGVSGCVELADQAESSRNSGKWKASSVIATGSVTGVVMTIATVTIGAFAIGQHVTSSAGYIGKIVSGSGLTWTLDQSMPGGVTSTTIYVGYTQDGIHTTANFNYSLYDNAAVPVALLC